MFKMAMLVLLSGIVQSVASAAGAPACPIENAAAAGQQVWLLCSDARVYVSQDQGVTWREETIPSSSQLRAISFLDAKRGFVAGDEGALLATRDGGKTWRPVTVPVKENLRSIFFKGDRGWISGWRGVMLHTSDAGLSWTRQDTGVKQSLERVFFIDEDRGWAVGWIGTMIRTTNGGRTWRQMEAPEVLWSLSSVYFRDPMNGWIVGFRGQILRSRDGGNTWVMQDSPTISWLTSVRFDSSGRGWITAEDRLLTSLDGGDSWQLERALDAVFLRRLLPVADSLWAVGRYSVLKQAAGGSHWETVERITATSG